MDRISNSFALFRARIGGRPAKDGANLQRSPSTPLHSSKKQKTDEQLKSHLFKLPYEVRMMIYQMVINAWGWGDRIHVVESYQLGYLPMQWHQQSFNQDGKDLMCVPCRAPPEDGDPAKMGMEPMYMWPDRHLQCREVDSRRVKSDLNMFLSCRRIYSEAIDLLYSTFAFDVHLPEAYPFFSAVPLQRLNQIKCLHVIWAVHNITYIIGPTPKENSNQSLAKCQRGEAQWLHICEIIRGMTGLKELRIRFFKSSLEDLWEIKLLESLTGIQIQDGNFVVELPGVYEREVGNPLTPPISISNTAPFTIQRRTVQGDRIRGVTAPYYDPDP